MLPIDSTTLQCFIKAQGKYELAEPMYQRVLEIMEKAFNGSHPNIATVLESYAGLLEKTGRVAEAGPLIERAEKMRIDGGWTAVGRPNNADA